MKEWKLGLDGFIMQYMLAGPVETPFTSMTKAPSQLDLEAMLRAEIVTSKPERWEEPRHKQTAIRMGEPAESGCRWSVYAAYGNCFIDVSQFYSTLHKINLEAATVLRAPADMAVRARVWSYMAVGIYCNGQLVGELSRPVYKPIQCQEVMLPLKQGRNLLFFCCENLGVRDTRSLLGVNILDHQEELRVHLPDEQCQDMVYDDVCFLEQLKMKDGALLLPAKAAGQVEYCCPVHSPDYAVMRQAPVWRPLDGLAKIVIPQRDFQVTVRVRGNDYELSRTLEFAERQRPEYLAKPEEELREVPLTCVRRKVLERIAAVESLNRDRFGFPIANILARKYLNKVRREDRELLFETLDLIEKRVDCSDFMVCGLLRYMHLYEMDEALWERTKQVLLNYRYWMSMDGTDGMCFWSENHALMFYLSAMDAGQFFPEEYFTLAGMTGRELYEFGKEKLLQWLKDVEEYGFEEFLSTVYMCLTFAALLNVIDFTEPEISRRASAIADQLIHQLCRQTFRGCVIAPMGRVYREVIYPFAQGTQSMISLLNPAAPYSYGEGWMAFLAGSSYRFPEGCLAEMEEEKTCSYASGNALIVLEKNDSYCLTSVQSPREDGYIRWQNIQAEPEANRDSHLYTKSFNECFHGTSFFQPGVYGYQQHLWYAALSPEAAIFVNHPGTSAERSGMRPGYWYGNGIIPAVKQVSGMLGAVCEIPENYPIHFTHVYCPVNRFDEVVIQEHWLFLRKDKGYLALWCSGAMSPYDDTIFDCEFRVYGSRAAYVCICGKQADYENLTAFAAYAESLQPVYDVKNRTLQTAAGFCLKYQEQQDLTQYIL